MAPQRTANQVGVQILGLHNSFGALDQHRCRTMRSSNCELALTVDENQKPITKIVDRTSSTKESRGFNWFEDFHFGSLESRGASESQMGRMLDCWEQAGACCTVFFLHVCITC